MSFDWGEYLLVAERLCDLSDGDSVLAHAACRAAVSRAYYSLYNKCLAHHNLRWGEVMQYEDQSGHAALEIAYRQKAPSFTGSRKEAAIAVADALKRYRRMRNQADYDDDLRLSKQSTRQAIGKIEKTLGRLAQI